MDRQGKLHPGRPDAGHVLLLKLDQGPVETLLADPAGLEGFEAARQLRT
jgi:hypothetical protein